MRITRRKFLKSGTTAAAIGAGVVLAPQIAQAQRGRQPSGIISGGPRGGLDSFNAIGNYSQADFEALIGSEFNLLSETYGHRTVTLTGVRAEDGTIGARTESFSLVFKGSDWQAAQQDVYYVTHNTLGYFHALMSPVRVSGRNGGICYEAVVNRLIS